MKFIEKIKVVYRANKYKNKNDVGGIAYMCSSIKTGQTVFDIGAHKGGFLYWMRNGVGGTGRVYAFEPQKNLFNYIKEIINLFNWKNVVVEHLALSNSEGAVTLYIPHNKKARNSSPGATIVEHKDTGAHFITQEVNTQTLDKYCATHNLQPSFLKIDVEGNELKVLQGGINTLQKYKPKILVEIEERHIGKEQVLETFHYLENLGYTGRIVQGKNYLPLSEFDFKLHQDFSNKETYCNNFIFE